MHTEIEAKVAIEALDPIAERLARLQASGGDEVRQRDTFFADDQGRLIDAGYGLRVRRQIEERATRTLLTLKGPRTSSRFKVRPETEVEVSDAEAIESILEGLGFHKVLVVEKKRRTWHMDTCEVCLDEVALLGAFVEIEGPDEAAVDRALKRLELDTLEPIQTSYAEMVRKRLAQMDSGKHEAVFDDE